VSEIWIYGCDSSRKGGATVNSLGSSDMRGIFNLFLASLNAGKIQEITVIGCCFVDSVKSACRRLTGLLVRAT
jgi:hypothetical protein